MSVFPIPTRHISFRPPYMPPVIGPLHRPAPNPMADPEFREKYLLLKKIKGTGRRRKTSKRKISGGSALDAAGTAAGILAGPVGWIALAIKNGVDKKKLEKELLNRDIAELLPQIKTNAKTLPKTLPPEFLEYYDPEMEDFNPYEKKEKKEESKPAVRSKWKY